MATTPTPRLTGRRRLYLMRHGHVDYFAPNITDFRAVPLTQEGRRQATQTGEALSPIAFNAVFTSGLPRTQETAARVVAECQHQLPAVVPVGDFEELQGGRVIVPTREELAARLALHGLSRNSTRWPDNGSAMP